MPSFTKPAFEASESLDLTQGSTAGDQHKDTIWAHSLVRLRCPHSANATTVDANKLLSSLTCAKASLACLKLTYCGSPESIVTRPSLRPVSSRLTKERLPMQPHCNITTLINMLVSPVARTNILKPFLQCLPMASCLHICMLKWN